jgi:hypothetical protein
VDYSNFNIHQLEVACKANQGKYMESHHQIICDHSNAAADEDDTTTTDITNKTKTKTILQLLHYPDCFGSDCKAADIQRLVARSVRHYEKALEIQLNHSTCTSEYEVHDDHMAEIMEQEQQHISNKDIENNGMVHEGMQELEGRTSGGESLLASSLSSRNSFTVLRWLLLALALG